MEIKVIAPAIVEDVTRPVQALEFLAPATGPFLLNRPRTAIVETARAYIGTPWQHTQRVKGVGIDCIGLLVCVSRELGMVVNDHVNYTYEDEFATMVAAIETHDGKRLPPGAEALPGDILIFRGRMMYNHCGYLATAPNGRPTLIHAYRSSQINKVVETPIDEKWLERLNFVYRYNGIIE